LSRDIFIANCNILIYSKSKRRFWKRYKSKILCGLFGDFILLKYL